VLREHGVVLKRCRGCLRVALLYPAVYEAAVASLAYQNLYYMLNSLEYVYAERFAASKMAGEEPLPRSLETGSALRDFDVVFVPVSYELDYVTLARMLLAAGIEPLAEKRRGKGPLLVLGGPVPSTNPLPALGLGDVVLVGEAEGLVEKIAEKVYEEGNRGVEALACTRGVLVKECTSPVRKHYVADLDSAFHSTMQFRVPGSGQPWGEAYMVEASRGCPHMCRFCMEAHFLLPTRHRSLQRLIDLIEKGVEANGVSRVAFYALSFFDYPDADRLLEKVYEMGLEASIGSLRADTLTEDRVEVLSMLGQSVVTVAPETLSPRLCRVIGKCILGDKVEEVASWAWKRRMHIKLYLMLGLPGERDEDVEQYAEQLRELSRKAPPVREAIRVSVNPLIPKPMTPLQYHPFIDRNTYERRVRILKRVSSRVLSIETLSYRYAYAQAVIARGDSAIPALIREWASMGGKLGQLWRAARSLEIDLERYTRSPEPLWHRFVDLGYSEKTLQLSYKYAYILATSQH
jgi:radical SAM superfamily enzyme YgiQ (UPF0313 family)